MSANKTITNVVVKDMPATEQQWLLSAPRRELVALTSLSANLSIRDAPRAVCGLLQSNNGWCLLPAETLEC